MPIPLKSQPTPSELAMSSKVDNGNGVVVKGTRDLEEATTNDSLVEYYLKACRRLHDSFFSFELQYPFEFLKQFGYSHVGPYYITLLKKAIGTKVLEDYRNQGLKYYHEKKDATFGMLFSDDGVVERWTLKIPVVEGEDSSVTLLRLKERLEFATGIKFKIERLLFISGGSESIFEGEEIVTKAIQRRVLVKISPRPGYPQNGPWCLRDIVPMIAMVTDRLGLHFPLEYRFRIWTTIWGTSKLATKLIEVNPDLLKEARSLGVGEEVFSETLNHPIPQNPGTELIPLELLESVCLIRGLLAYMNAHGLIRDSAGYDLTPKEV